MNQGSSKSADNRLKQASADFVFSGSQVVITGSSQGIGLGIAKAFAAAGADILMLANDAKGEQAALDIRRWSRGDVDWVECDITDRDNLKRWAGGLPPVDVLVCNAGIELHTPVQSTDPAVDQRFEQVIGVNLTGTWNVVRNVLPTMVEGGRIIVTSSIWGKIGQANLAAYSASKHALIGLTRTLARELGGRRISVNAVCPGWVHTPSENRSLEELAKTENRVPEELLEEILSVQAFPGIMQPEDIAEIYLFLASDAARNITGQTITVDRGELMI